MRIQEQFWIKAVNYNKAMADKKLESSPDISVPSVAETSFASSQQPEDEEEEEDVSRVLFLDDNNQNHELLLEEEDDEEQKVVENIQRISEEEAEKGKRQGGEGEQISITSSETTAVAAWNLSPRNDEDMEKSKPSNDNTESLYLLEEVSSIAQSSSDGDDDATAMDDVMGAFPTSNTSTNETKLRRTLVTVVETNNANSDTRPFQSRDTNRRFVMEDPPKDLASCNQALKMTPRQLSDMFLALEGKSKTLWPTASRQENSLKGSSTFGSDRSTASRWIDGWMSQTETLEKENKPLTTVVEEDLSPRNESLKEHSQTLKAIVEENSIKLLSLQQAIDTQRQLNALKEIEIGDKEKELVVAKKLLKSLTEEKEAFHDRKEDLVDTIKILKTEIKNLTIRNAEMDEIRLMEQEEEREAWKTQVHEQELVINVLRKTVEEKEQENLSLVGRLADYENNRLPESEEEDNPGNERSEGCICQGGEGDQPVSLTSETPWVVNLDPEATCCQGNLPSETQYKQPSAETSSELLEMVSSISKRLEAVELDKHRTEILYIKQLKEKDEEIDKMRDMMKNGGPQEAMWQDIAQDPDEIEAVLKSTQKQAIIEDLQETEAAIIEDLQETEAVLKKTQIHTADERTEDLESALPVQQTSGCCCWSAITGDLE